MTKHTQAYINGVLNLMRNHSFAAGIEWERVRRTALKIAEKSSNAYDADREFCYFLYLKQLEETTTQPAARRAERNK